MILWCDGPHGARDNMRRDAALLHRVTEAKARTPVLRLFRFAPPGITLGHSQDPGRELDLERASRDGIEWSRRPTGGRAIFHDEEWTFSLATPLAPAGWAADAPAAYAQTCELLARALARLGIPVRLSAGTARGVGRPRAAGGPAAPCFASTARHELTLEGRKFAGIAQRATRGALLQQGSLLLGPSHLRLLDYLLLPEAERSVRKAALAETAAHAGPYLPAARPLELLWEALARELPGAECRHGEEALPLPSA